MQELLQKTQKMKVLYVEDDDNVRLQTLGVLQILFPNNTDIATNGLEGWKKYQATTYDLVLTDISMPKMNGIELSKKIKEQNSSQSIIIISAHNAQSNLLEAIELNIDGFLLKPIKMDKFIPVIEKQVNS